MAIAINGTGTITGISVGGLNDSIITSSELANAAVTAAKLAAGAGGKILQVVSTTKTDTFKSSSQSFIDITGMSVSITPSATSSKILVFVNLAASMEGGTNFLINLLRDSTNIAQGTSTATHQVTGAFFVSTTGSTNIMHNFHFLDSPATASAITYKVQGRSTNVGYDFAVNQRQADTFISAVSSITAFEVKS
jgi:hypothetical protein